TVAHVAGHLLALEHLAGVLALAGRTMRTVRHGHAVRGAQAAEVVALHAAGKALADRGTGDIDALADDEVVGLHRRANLDEALGIDAELDDLALRLNLGLGEIAAVGLGEA